MLDNHQPPTTPSLYVFLEKWKLLILIVRTHMLDSHRPLTASLSPLSPSLIISLKRVEDSTNKRAQQQSSTSVSPSLSQCEGRCRQASSTVDNHPPLILPLAKGRPVQTKNMLDNPHTPVSLSQGGGLHKQKCSTNHQPSLSFLQRRGLCKQTCSRKRSGTVS